MEYCWCTHMCRHWFHHRLHMYYSSDMTKHTDPHICTGSWYHLGSTLNKQNKQTQLLSLIDRPSMFGLGCHRAEQGPLWCQWCRILNCSLLNFNLSVDRQWTLEVFGQWYIFCFCCLCMLLYTSLYFIILNHIYPIDIVTLQSNLIKHNTFLTLNQWFPIFLACDPL